MNKYNSTTSVQHNKNIMKTYAELVSDYKKYRIKSLYDNKKQILMFMMRQER